MSTVVVLLLMALVAVLLWGFSTQTTRPVTSLLQGTGTTPRGSIRLNISDEAYDRHHAKYQTGLSAKKVRRNATDVAYIYHDRLTVTWDGQPAVILGFKDQHLAGKSTVDYGHIITKDGKHIVGFEAVAVPVTCEDKSILAVRLTSDKGVQISRLVFSTEAKAREKKVRFSLA